MRAAKALELIHGNGHGFFQEDMNPSLEAFTGDARLEEEEGSHHRDVRFLPVEHAAVVVVVGNEGGLHLVDEELAGILVGGSRRHADEAQLRQPIAHLQGEVDVTAGADDHCLHGRSSADTIAFSPLLVP